MAARVRQRLATALFAAALMALFAAALMMSGAPIAAPARSPLALTWEWQDAHAMKPPAVSAVVNTCPTPKSYVLTRVPATMPKNVALTFDDGPSPRWTPQILDILKANRVHATFFMVGQYARSYPRLVRRVVAEGHTVGNHTLTHPHMNDLSATRQASQLDAATRAISAAVPGGYKPCFFRPPNGAYNSTTVRLARARGMSTVLWTHDTRDWTTPLHLSSSFQRTIVYRATHPVTLHPNVLTHDGSPGNYRQNTVNNVKRIITFYKSRGYRFTNPAGR